MTTQKAPFVFVPDEAAPHSVTWIGWPTAAKIYGKALLANVQADIVLLAHTIAKYEPVNLVVDPEHVDRAKALLYPPDSRTSSNNSNSSLGTTTRSSLFAITVVASIRTNDMWLRDTGPVFRVDGRTGRVVDSICLNFNGWGNKQKHEQDKLVAQSVAELAQLSCVRASIRGEGGGVEWDGDGTLLATETSWVNRNRNGAKSKEDIEAELLALYGATQMIWLPGVLSRDDITDDHIDGMARFVAPGKVVLNMDPNSTAMDPFSRNVRVVKTMLEAATDSTGRSLDIVLLPPPDPTRVRCKSKDLLYSYCNFLVVNGAVINASFGDAIADDRARQLLEGCFPARAVEMIPLDHLYCCGGGIHCVTQHQPKSKLI